MQHDDLSPSSAQPVSPKRSWLKKPAVLIAAGVVLLAAALFGGKQLYDRSQKNTEAASNKGVLTLYYRDGKTLLWSSASGDSPTNPAPAFVNHVRMQLATIFSETTISKTEMRVTTTLDANLQRTAREQLAAKKDELTAKNRVQDVLFIAEDVTNGQIVSWVGGFAEASSAQKIVYTPSKIEVGSLMLPFTYAAFLETHPSATADTQLEDVLGYLPGYLCANPATPPKGGDCLHNFDYKFLGPVSVRQALGGHRLVPGVRAILAGTDINSSALAVNDVLGVTRSMGGSAACYLNEVLERQEETQCYGAALYGEGLIDEPISILQTYATLANSGKKAAQTPFLSITIKDKPFTGWESSGEQIISEATANTITDILRDIPASYMSGDYAFVTSKGLRLGAASGFEADGQTFGIMQFSSTYAVGLWAFARDDQSRIAGFLERPLYTAAAAWHDTTE